MDKGNGAQTADKYRHEFKYLCTESQLQILRVRLKGIMNMDAHAGREGKYVIKSLYFDDGNDRCYNENESGVSPREKYRIRIYNNSKERISLECKRKDRDKVKKTSCLLTQEQFDYIAYSKGGIAGSELPGLAKKLLLLKKSSRMEPKVIVSYERTPFVYKNGNVRVTFDRNIASSGYVEGFFRENICRRQILPAGWQLLEVKYDEYLPDYIYHALSLSNLERITFSKYYLCRKFNV